MSRTVRYAAAASGAAFLLATMSGPAYAASPEPRSCQPTLTWGVTMDPAVKNVDIIAEQKLVAKGFATAAFLSRTAGLNLSYVAIGNTMQVRDGYAGYDYVPSPPTVTGPATVPLPSEREVSIIVVLANPPDKVDANGETTLGEIEFSAGRTIGTYDMSVMMTYPPAARQDFYMQMGLSLLKGFPTTRCR